MQTFPFVHSIFYSKNNCVDEDELIEKIQPYIYTGRENGFVEKVQIEPLAPQSSSLPPPPPPPSPTEPIQETPVVGLEYPHKPQRKYFEPEYNADTIFWCIFQHVYGERELEYVGRMGNRMLEEKQKIVEHFKKNPKSLKQSNLKFTNEKISATISELMCARGESSFLVLAAYAVFYKINIYLVDEERKIYLKFLPDTSFLSDPDSDEKPESVCVLYKNPKSKSSKHAKYRKMRESTHEELSVVNAMCELIQYDKPVSGISTYTIAKLEEIANKLNVALEDGDGKRLKKPDLYKRVWEQMEWKM